MPPFHLIVVLQDLLKTCTHGFVSQTICEDFKLDGGKEQDPEIKVEDFISAIKRRKYAGEIADTFRWVVEAADLRKNQTY